MVSFDLLTKYIYQVATNFFKCLMKRAVWVVKWYIRPMFTSNAYINISNMFVSTLLTHYLCGRSPKYLKHEWTWLSSVCTRASNRTINHEIKFVSRVIVVFQLSFTFASKFTTSLLLHYEPKTNAKLGGIILQSPVLVYIYLFLIFDRCKEKQDIINKCVFEEPLLKLQNLICPEMKRFGEKSFLCAMESLSSKYHSYNKCVVHANFTTNNVVLKQATRYGTVIVRNHCTYLHSVILQISGFYFCW